MLLVAAVGGVLGAGFGQLTSDEGGGGNGNSGSSRENGDDGIDLSVDTTGTPNTPVETGTPTESPEPTDDDTTDADDDDTTDADDDDTPTDTETGTVTTGEDDDDGPDGTTTRTENAAGGGGSGPGGGTENEGSARTTVTTSPIAFRGIMPGDEGRVTVTLSLSGGSARLWVRGDASRFEERGLLEPERAAGDHDRQGELQEYVRVRLRYEGDGIFDGGRVLHEGSLASLADMSWTSLVEGCAAPGEYDLTLEWRLPADTPNTVQSDAARFSLGFLGESCSNELG